MSEYDVVVCGSGPAGCAAALAARRAGLSVLLVEAQGQLGGMGTSGLISHWLGGRRADGTWVVGGIFRELAEEAAARGFALLPRAEPGRRYTPHGWLMGLVHGVPFAGVDVPALRGGLRAAGAILEKEEANGRPPSAEAAG